MILIDATPLQSEHRLRGVGVYLRQLIEAIELEGAVRPWYLTSAFGPNPNDSRSGPNGLGTTANTSGHEPSALGTNPKGPGTAPDALGASSNGGGINPTGLLLPPERTRRMLRPHRPAQVYWLYNELALRGALLRARARVFFAPDFNGVVPNPHGRTVAVLHDLTELKLARFSPNPSRLLSDLRWQAYARKLRAVDRIIAVSNSAKRDAMTLLGIPEARIRVIHHGVDHARFRPPPAATGEADQPPYLLHIGGFNANKNQARILEAFAHVARAHPTVRLHFAGPWHAADMAWLEERAKALGVAGRVQHLGYVADRDLPRVYGHALAFLFPSLEEGFGLPVLEAMACGTPVVTSDRSSLPEVAGGAALLADPTSVEALAAGIRRVVEEPAERERLRQLGLRRAAAFTWRSTAEQTLETLLSAG